MKTYYSIIFSQLSSVSKERLNIGLLMVSEQMVKFQFAAEKVAVLKKLLPDDAVKLINVYLKGISNKVEMHYELHEPSASITENYINYLSDYSNNLVSFTKPEALNVALNDHVFEQLFNKLIYKSNKPKEDFIKMPVLDVAKKNFLDKVYKRVNVTIELTSDNLPFILFPITIDMIGRNDKPVLSQFIDFSANPTVLRNGLSSYINLIKPFELAEKKDGKFFIVGNEPLKANKYQHQIWEHLRSSSLEKAGIIEIVPEDEIDAIESYLSEHDVQPFFK